MPHAMDVCHESWEVMRRHVLVPAEVEIAGTWGDGAIGAGNMVDDDVGAVGGAFAN